jgi:LPLT family lysophospholipid transporter-like MFS transporter
MALVAAYTPPPPHALNLAALAGSGFDAGLHLTPHTAALQSESDPAKLGKTVATQNFLENLAMSLGCGAVLLAAHSGARPPHIFIGLGLFVAVSVIGLKMPRSRPAVSPDPNPLNALDRTS